MTIFSKEKKQWKDFLLTADKPALVKERIRIEEEIEKLRDKKRDIRDAIVELEQEAIQPTPLDQEVRS